jgi:Putative phage serine protease XkdF
VRVAVEARLVRLVKRDARGMSHAFGDATVQAGVPVKKLDEDEQIVWGEVYAPGFVDSQGDFMTPEEVKKACYNFMRKGNLSNIDTNHSQTPNGSYVVENFIARPDDSIFIPGSWVMGVKVPDPGTWQMVKSGELNGFSLDGYGTRTDAVFAVEMPELLKGETTESDSHTHSFQVRFDHAGNFMGGRTSPGPDGHVHKIERGTVTERAGFPAHNHRFSFVEGVLNASV